MANDLPQQPRRRAADQRVQCGDATDGHEVVHRGDQQNFNDDTDRVKRRTRKSAERPAVAEQKQIFLADGEHVGHDEGARKQRQRDESNVTKRQREGNKEMALVHLHAMQEYHRYRTLQHRERERGKKQHRHQQHPAHHGAVFEKRGKLLHQRRRLPRCHPLQRAPQGRKQDRRIDHLRQTHHHQNQQRHDRQQRVVRHRTCKQQPLIGTECAHHLQRERGGVLNDLLELRGEEDHDDCRQALLLGSLFSHAAAVTT